MRSLISGRTKFLLAIFAAAVLASCTETGNEPVVNLYVVENATSCAWLSFDENLSPYSAYYYIGQGENSCFNLGVGYAARANSSPDAVAATISVQDSAMEIVPSLMSDEAPYSMLSGLDQWIAHKTLDDDLCPDSYTLTLTDEAMAFISSRMRSKGRPPYKIIREEICNPLDEEITVTPLLNGVALAEIKIPAGETVVLPEVNLFFKCDKYKIKWGDKSTESTVAFMANFESHTFRDGDTEEGCRRYCFWTTRLERIFESDGN